MTSQRNHGLRQKNLYRGDFYSYEISPLRLRYKPKWKHNQVEIPSILNFKFQRFQILEI